MTMLTFLEPPLESHNPVLSVEPPGPSGSVPSPQPLAYCFARVFRGRPTNVFNAPNTDDESVVIQSASFRERWSHGARLEGYASSIGHITKERAVERSRIRVPFSNIARLRDAETVNELLKAVYDVLEGMCQNNLQEDLRVYDTFTVHRIKLVQRNVLHHDMSLHNVLMYPAWGSMKGRQVHAGCVPTVQDVLSREIR